MSVYKRFIVSFVILAATLLLLFQNVIRQGSVTLLSTDSASSGPFPSLDKQQKLNRKRSLWDIPADLMQGNITEKNNESTDKKDDKANIKDNKADVTEKKTDATIEKIDLKTAISLAQDVLNLIRHRYELDGVGSMFALTANNVGPHTWDLMKYKYAKKIIMRERFLMTFGGSSVTAGHDNYYNQSYPSVVRRRMGPILEAAGVTLLVHNIAQGANNCIPYTHCYESMGGADPDFLGWEQSYNCGRSDDVFEMMGRLAMWSENKAVVYYSASGAWNPEKCPPSNSTPAYSSEDWDPLKEGLPKWSPTHDDVEHEKKSLFTFNQAHETAGRFASFVKGVPGYSKLAYHGFNVWEPNPKCNVPGKANCNGMDAAQVCTMKFMTHEAGIYGSDEGGGAGWHPPRGMHLLRGEMIVWLYTLALLDAMYMVQGDLAKHSTEDLKKQYVSKLSSLTVPLPNPVKCEQNLACKHRPRCHTNFMPHYSSDMTLSELVIGSHNWTVDLSGIADIVNRTALGSSDWSLHYGYLDEKPIIYGNADQGEIHLRITIGETNFLWLCGGGHKDSLKHAHIFIDLNVDSSKYPSDSEKIGEYGLNYGNSSYVYVPQKDRKLWEKKKYVGNECKAILDLPQGNHILTVFPSQHMNHTAHVTKLSHVIMWA